jgi:hypothetical protein
MHVLHPTVRNKEEVFVRPDSALCPEYGFDAPSIEIMWSSDGHPDQRLDYYDGCLNPAVPDAESKHIIEPAILPAN